LSVTLFLVAMAEITHGIEEPIKIVGYADDWIIHTTHKHDRASVVKLKAMDKIVKWADDTGFQIPIEKKKSHHSAAKILQEPPDQDWIWVKGTKIEQVRIFFLRLNFDTRMNCNEHILSTKAKAGKKLSSSNA
jgi:hypothetical protein